MKKNNFTGWKDVFAFTFAQNFKSKSTIITTVIFLVAALFMLPIMTAIQGNDTNNTIQKLSVENVHIINETEIDLDIAGAMKEILAEEDAYKEITYDMSSMDRQQAEKELQESKDLQNDLLMILTYDQENGYEAEFKYSKESKASEAELESYANYFAASFQRIMAQAMGVSQDQVDRLLQEVETQVRTYTQEGTDGEEEVTAEQSSWEEGQYFVMLILICVTIFLVSFAGEGIAGAVITEKSSKIIEFLLTSIRPMAIIIGKVLAMFTTVIVEVLILVVGVAGSYLLNGYINGGFGMKSLPQGVRDMLNGDMLRGLHPVNIILAVILLLCGILLYGMIAGLVGSMINKIEEMAEGLKLYNFVMIIGAYASIALAIANLAGGCPYILNVLGCVIPLTAPFCLPGLVIIGEISGVVCVLAIAVMILSLALLTIFTSNVYEDIIYHNGERMRMRDVVRIFRNNRREAADSE